METKADAGLNQWEAKECKDGQKPPEATTGKEGSKDPRVVVLLRPSWWTAAGLAN